MLFSLLAYWLPSCSFVAHLFAVSRTLSLHMLFAPSFIVAVGPELGGAGRSPAGLALTHSLIDSLCNSPTHSIPVLVLMSVQSVQSTCQGHQTAFRMVLVLGPEQVCIRCHICAYMPTCTNARKDLLGQLQLSKQTPPKS